MTRRIYDLVEANPVIAAVKNDEGLKRCCGNENIRVVFVLYGDICNITSIVKHIHESGKAAIVHIDLIDGLSGKDVAVEFIKQNTAADGIISTRPSLIKKAKSLSLYTILRIFVLDSMAYTNIQRQVSDGRPDMIEILPGLMPKVIRHVCSMVHIPVLAGGLIREKEEVLDALSAGAIAISTTNIDVWEM